MPGSGALTRARARLERLEAEIRPPDIPADRLQFAWSTGLSELDPWQERLLGSDATRVLLNCSRQSGKSTMSALLALHKALTEPGSLVLALAPALRQSQELFQKIASQYRSLGQSVPSFADSHRKLGMELSNGSRIEALPGTEKTIRGFSGAALLLVDEAARVDDSLYYAVRPMLAVSGGHLILLSTPYGKRGVFFEEWTGSSAWERYEVPATQCPRIPSEFLEEERRALPDWVYRQEYCCEFVETEDQVFSHDLVSAAISSEVEPLFGSEAGVA